MIYILAGMHRSGTSMFARYMHESGICMGNDFYRDETANKYGHFEDLDFLNLQRQELSSAFNGEDYLIFKPFRLSDQFIEKSKALFEKRIQEHGQNDWGWKDPRTTVFIKHWQKNAHEIRYIFLVRKPEAVINSLCKLLKTKWSFTEKTKYLNTYIYYNRQILNFAQNHEQHKFAILSFEKLIAEPENELQKLSKRIGFQFDPELFKKQFDGKIISPKQPVPYFFLRPQLNKAGWVYQSLSEYF